MNLPDGVALRTPARTRRRQVPRKWASRTVAPMRITQPAAGEPAAVFVPPPICRCAAYPNIVAAV